MEIYGLWIMDFLRRTTSDKIFCDKAFNIAKNSKHDGDQRDLPSMFFVFFLIKNVLC